MSLLTELCFGSDTSKQMVWFFCCLDMLRFSFDDRSVADLQL